VPAVTEAELLTAVRAACRQLPVRCYHTRYSVGSEPGFPDLVIVGRGGVLFRELKGPRGRLSDAQRAWLDDLRAAGADADVWWAQDGVARAYEEILAVAGVEAAR
jgi:hypothetical protein